MLIKSSVWSFLASVIEKVLSLLTYAIVARQVGKESFGLLVSVFLVVEFLGYFSSFGVSDNIVRQKNVEAPLLDSSFKLLWFVSIFISVFLLLILFPYFYYWGGVGFVDVFLLMAVYPLIVLFVGFYKGILQQRLQFKDVAVFNIQVSVVSGFLGMVLALLGCGIVSLIVSKYVQSLCQLVIYAKRSGYSYAGRARIALIKSIFSFGWKVSLAQVFNFSANKYFEMLVVVVFGAPMLAVVDVGRKFSQTLNQLVLTPMVPVSLSYLSKSRVAKSEFIKIVIAIQSFLVPIAAFLHAHSEFIIGFVFGEEWFEAIVVLQLFSGTVVAQVVLWLIPAYVMSKGSAGEIALLHFTNFIVLVTCSVVALAVFQLNFYEMLKVVVSSLYFSAVIQLLWVFRSEFKYSLLLIGVMASMLLAFYWFSSVYADVLGKITNERAPDFWSFLFSGVVVYGGYSVSLIAILYGGMRVKLHRNND